MKKYSLDQYSNTAKFLDKILWSKDEDYIIYSSDKDGSFDMFKYELKNDKIEKLTDLGRTTIPITEMPGNESFLFSYDSDGDEMLHLYIYDEGVITDITPWEESRNQFMFWHPNKLSFFICSNRRTPKSMDLYEVKISSMKPKLVYENNDFLEFHNISPNGINIICGKTAHRELSKILLLDLSNKNLVELSEDSKEANDIGYCFNSMGDGIYMASNHNSEFDVLYEFDIESKKRTIVYEGNHSVIGFKVSKEKNIGEIQIFEDARHKIKLINLNTKEMIQFNTQAEFILSVNLSDSGRLLTYKSQNSNIPYRLSIYNLDSQKEKLLIDGGNPEIDHNSYVKAKDAIFKSFDDLDIPAILYMPKNASANAPVPAMIWVHGGPGGVSMHNFDYETQYYIDNNIAVLAVNNRGSYGYGKTFYNLDSKKHGQDDLMDCIYGKKYLQSLDNIIDDRIGIFGGSYGGYMVGAALAFQPKEFKLGINIFGVMNWVRTLKGIPSWWEGERDRLYKHIGNPYEEEEYLKSISPLFHAKKIEKPLLVAQGANDPRVIKAESDEIVQQVKENGVAVEYVLFEDEGHGFNKVKNRKYFIKRSLKFMEKHL